MKNIVYRESYIKSIKKSIGSNLIKIITGIRGAGKSTILSEIIKYVHSKNDESYVISMDFSLKPFSDIKNEIQLFEYLQSRIKNKKDKYYLFLDEIQNVKNFENIILHFYSGYNVEIFITGSSSYLLSKQIGTKFTRRHIDFEIFPFTFLELKEYCLINNISLNDQELLEKMIMFGGLPLTYQIPDDLKIKWLSSLSLEIVEKDILPNQNIGNLLEFNKIFKYVMQQIGQLFSYETIYSFLKKEDNKNSTAKTTIISYIKALNEANLLSTIERYNIIGKELMAYKTKYYAYDIGIRNAVVDNWKNLDLPKIIENIVYLELLKRGYNVKIGKTYSWEVDFVAFKNGTITYIQVCESLYSEEKYKQELDPLKSIKDNYEKIVITYQKDIRENDNGIKIVSLIDFLRKH